MEKVEDHIIELVDISPSSPENSEAGCPQCSRLLLFISEISKLALAELRAERERGKGWRRVKPPTGLEHSNFGNALVEPYFVEDEE